MGAFHRFLCSFSEGVMVVCTHFQTILEAVQER
jgi:hypothetical protein